MTTTLSLTAASSDLIGYLQDYAANPPSNAYGSFNPSTLPYDQWIRGDASSTYVAVLDGDFSAYNRGNLVGTAESLTLGYGLTYDSTTGLYSAEEAELTFDFNSLDTTGTDSFDYAVYGLMNNNLSYVYDFLAATGTEQVGTSGADTLYSFGGSDVLTGNGGSDTFSFDLSDTGASVIGTDTISDFDVASEVIELGLDDSAYDSYAEILAATSDTAAGTVIDLGDYGSITLTGVEVADLSSDNFAFV